MAKAIEIFLGARATCMEFTREALEEVAVDIIDHDNETYIMFHDYHTMFWATERLDTSRNDVETERRQIIQVLAKFFLGNIRQKSQIPEIRRWPKQIHLLHHLLLQRT